MTDETKVGNVDVNELLAIIAEKGEIQCIKETTEWALKNKGLWVLPTFIQALTEDADEACLKSALDTLNQEPGDDNWLEKLPEEEVDSILESLVDYYTEKGLDEDTLETFAYVFLLSVPKAIDLLAKANDIGGMAEMVKLMFKNDDC